jgi:phenylacetate-coenzyme A ligase PaaK-like adenylate-forming protein
MCIIELVDEDNRPVADGTPSAKVLVTNLHNRTQPLIRYELTDRFVRRPAGGDPYLHATVQGRADEAFRYGTVTVDALMIRTVMVRVPDVAEYQVRQTGDGIDVALVAEGAVDHAALAASLERVLRGAGVSAARVHVREVAAIPRLPHSGKTRRFIPR